MRKKKSEMIILLAEIYGEEMTESRLLAYLKILDDMTLGECQLAFSNITNDASIRRMPLPAQIKAAARPMLSPREEAVRRLSMIREAVRQFGWPNPDKAQDFLGEEIWNDVLRMGGWKHLCESPECNINDSIKYAQMRDGIASAVQAERDGIDYSAQALPGGKNKTKDVISGLANLKSLEGGLNGES